MEPTDSAVITGVMTVDEVVSAVCAMCEKRGVKMSMDWLRSKDRQQVVCSPRHIAMYVCRMTCGMSLSEIGRRFNRGHATVYSAVNSISGLMTVDKYVVQMMTDVYSALGMEFKVNEEVPMASSSPCLDRELEQIRIHRMVAIPIEGLTQKQISRHRKIAWARANGKVHMAGSMCKNVLAGTASRIVSRDAFVEAHNTGFNGLCVQCHKRYLNEITGDY